MFQTTNQYLIISNPWSLEGPQCRTPMSQSPASGCANPPFSSANDQVTNSFVHGLVENCGNDIFFSGSNFHFIGTSTWRWLMALQILQLSFGGPFKPSTPGRVIWVAVDSWSRRRWAAWRIDNWSDLAMVHIGQRIVQPKSKRVIAGVNFQLSSHMSHFVWSS